MKHFFLPPILLTLIVSISSVSCSSNPKTNKATTDNISNSAIDTSALHLEKNIELPYVKGGFDLMAIDVKGQRLFVSAEDNHTIEVINLQTGKLDTSLAGFNEPKWVFYLPETNRIYVSGRRRWKSNGVGW